jgi:hypothetical protein
MKNTRTYVAGVGIRLWEELRNLLGYRSSFYDRVAPPPSTLKVFCNESSSITICGSRDIPEKRIPEIKFFTTLLQESGLTSEFYFLSNSNKLPYIIINFDTANLRSLANICHHLLKYPVQRIHYRLLIFQSD